MVGREARQRSVLRLEVTRVKRSRLGWLSLIVILVALVLECGGGGGGRF